MKIKIGAIRSITDEHGKYGPQKKVVFIDSSGRSLSGWIALEKFDETAWVIGNVLDLEVTQNGKYTNFKLLAAAKAGGAVPVESVSMDNNDVMTALRAIYKLLVSIKEIVSKPPSHKTPPLPPPPWEDVDGQSADLGSDDPLARF